MVDAVIQVAPFPDVPVLPGVPQLARSLLFPPSPGPTLGQNAAPQLLFQAVKQKPVWGVFDANGNRVIDADSVRTFDFRQEHRISDYPVQQGQFASYNKVIVPYDVSVRLVKGGTVNDRTNFLNQCAAVEAAVGTYTVLTPEQSYTNVTGVRMEVGRHEVRGAFFVEVELFLRYVNETQAQYTTTGDQTTSTVNAQDPTAQPAVNQGYVQAQPPDAQTIASVNEALQPTTPLAAADMYTVPLGSVPSQTLGITLDGQSCGLRLYQRNTGGTFMDLTLGGSAIATGDILRYGSRALQDRQYLGFKGDFTLVDTHGTSNPLFAGLGQRFQMVYLRSSALGHF